ncbi:hypothetical protein ACVILH_004810 [Bradyrhizobium sp. USDA 4353]
MIAAHNPTALDRRDLAVEPVLLKRECAPALGHALETTKSWLSLRALGELETIISVLAEKI